MKKRGACRRLMVAATMLAISAGQAAPALAQQTPYTISGAALVPNSTGLDNPYTLLRRPDVQAIAHEALAGPLTRERLAALLRGSDVTIDHLLRADILAPLDAGRYRLAMTVLPAEDRRLLDRVSARYASSLAEAFLAERPAIDRILARYDMPGVDPEVVRMALIGCVTLDWDGLGVTARGGYRAAPVPKANGDRFQMVLRGRAPDVSGRALYFGSHNAQTAGNRIWMTTFGDHAGQERAAFPDLTWIIDEGDFAGHSSRTLAPQLSSLFASGMSDAQDLTGAIMIALRDGPADVAALARAIRQTPARTEAVLGLLQALQYVELREGRYRAIVPVFTYDRDHQMLAEYRELGRQIMRRWLAANYERIRGELSGLAALRAGVPYPVMFTEIWHPLFGWTNYHLVRRGYLHDPYGPTSRFMSFVPFVWEARLDFQEGSWG